LVSLDIVSFRSLFLLFWLGWYRLLSADSLRLPSVILQLIDCMLAIHHMNSWSIDVNLIVAPDTLISEPHGGRAARKIGLSCPESFEISFLTLLLARVGSRMELTPRAPGSGNR
jgi:hypothetical protein